MAGLGRSSGGEEAVIVSVARSPIGRAFRGSLAPLRAEDLARQMIEAVLAKVPQFDPQDLDDIHLGTSVHDGEQGANMARVLAVLLGLDQTPGTTINRFCASSLQTTRMAMHAIRAGEAKAILSVGVESVSRVSRVSGDHPSFADLPQSSHPWTDPRRSGLLPNIYISMGETAENVATLRGVSREEMDEFGYRSQMLAKQAAQAGFWDLDITPVVLPDGTVVDRDDSPRPTTTLDALAKLAPAFREEGTVTAGNCCPLNDGAAAVLVMSASYARQLGIEPLARIMSTAVSGLSPEIMGLGPVESVQRALALAGLTMSDVDQVEINEAFAAQVIPCYRDLNIPLERLNVNGGAIALGHPFGMTGARITTTLINSLKHHDQAIGIETMCAAGGMGMAMVIERLS